jgi:hypothetical protein
VLKLCSVGVVETEIGAEFVVVLIATNAPVLVPTLGLVALP